MLELGAEQNADSDWTLTCTKKSGLLGDTFAVSFANVWCTRTRTVKERFLEPPSILVAVSLAHDRSANCAACALALLTLSPPLFACKYITFITYCRQLFFNPSSPSYTSYVSCKSDLPNNPFFSVYFSVGASRKLCDGLWVEFVSIRAKEILTILICEDLWCGQWIEWWFFAWKSELYSNIFLKVMLMDHLPYPFIV
jgi:hypothetical protein